MDMKAPPPMADHESNSMMTEEQDVPASESGLKVDSVTVRQAKNGGFIVTCSKSPVNPNAKNGPSYQSHDYAFSSLDEVANYLGQEFGGTNPDAGTTSGSRPAMPAPSKGY